MVDPTFKSLASWKSWWHGGETAKSIAESILKHVDPEKVPGDGKLVLLQGGGKVTEADLKDPHTSKVIEGLLQSYPSSKDPSGYLLGDSVLLLNTMLGHTILGTAKANPVDEKSRRDQALKQGHYLKMLLSYVRTASGRCDKGWTPEVTYLKELAIAKGRPERRGKGSQSSPSVTSVAPTSPTSSTRSAVTIGLDGNPLSSYSSPPISACTILDK